MITVREILIPEALRAAVVRELRGHAHGDGDVRRVAEIIERMPASMVRVTIAQGLADRCAEAIGAGWPEGGKLFKGGV